MPEDKGYEAGEEESKKIEEILARRREEPEFEGEPEESIEEDIEDYAEDVDLAQKVETPRSRFKAEEPILLYIRTGVGTYTVVDKQFGSRVEATRFAEENYKGTKYKVMALSEAVAEGQKQQARMEKIQQAKEKAKEKIVGGAKRIAQVEVKPRVKRYAQAGLEASYDVARAQGMTRPQMEPRIREAWGVEERRAVQRPPPRAPPGPPRQRMGFGAPPRRRTGIYIPPGGGVFAPSRGRGIRPESPQSPFQRRPIRTAPAFGRTPIRGMRRAELHMITPRGISTGRRYPQPEPEQPPKPKKKKRKKSKKKRRKK